MSAAELDAASVAQLQPLAEAGDLGLLLGAGASVAAGLPNWDTLAMRLLVLSGAVAEEATARAFLARQDAALAAEAARASADDWVALVRRALYEASGGEPEPAVLHLAAAALAVQMDPGRVRLFTLNLDPLLEGALRLALAEEGRPAGVFARAEPAPRALPGDYEVHHLHGILGADGGDARGIVLTLQDFVDLGKQAHPWQVASLQEATQRGPLVLAGTSYRDPDIRQWLSDITQAYEPVVMLAREGLGLSRAEFARVRPALIAQWEAIGVRAITFHDHADAAQALRELPCLTRGDYHPPQERAAVLWQCHLTDFVARQREHACQLETDVERLRAHLGADANLTLWLADGEGQLVRWAAHDRVYLRPQDLRRIEPGHDSPVANPSDKG